MAATTAGAVKAHLETLGLGIAVYNRAAPQGVSMPYLTVSDGLALVPEGAFNQHDDAEGHVEEMVQIDVWQLRATVSHTLPDAVANGLRGAHLTGLPSYSPRSCLLDGGPVWVPDPDPDVVHHAVTVLVKRTLARRP